MKVLSEDRQRRLAHASRLLPLVVSLACVALSGCFRIIGMDPEGSPPPDSRVDGGDSDADSDADGDADADAAGDGDTDFRDADVVDSCLGYEGSDPRAFGSGTAEDPFVLCNEEQLSAWVSAPSTEHAALGGDIELTSGVRSPGGRLQGSFDGRGYRVRGLVISGSLNVGLFADVASGAVVRDLELVDVVIEGQGQIGALAGVAGSAIIESTRVTGTVTGTGTRVGGLVGNASGTTIRDAHADVVVVGVEYVGGLVGSTFDATVEASSAAGSVTGTPDEGCTYAGGLVGYCVDGSVSRCFASVTVASGGAANGGLVGWSQRALIENCYATGEVSGGRSADAPCSTVYDLTVIGGLIGVDYNGVVRSCYATGATNGLFLAVAGLVGHTWTESALASNFATGRVTAGGEGGGVYGRLYGGSETNSWWSIPGTGCENMAGSGAGVDSRGIDDPDAATYFFSRANPPLDDWDFDTVWVEHPDRLPTLRWQASR